MRNALAIFKGDLKRLVRNPITIIVVVGLIVLPSIFSWYNMLACWNVFDNTGTLKVAVANSDKGYESDLVPFELNLGESVVSALRENEQLDWVFTNEEDAIDGVNAGRYYAAVVIPETFSRDLMSFYSDDVEHAKITYYSNEKKSAIAPKITDQGADQVSAQVNQTFVETLSKVALEVSWSLIDSLEEGGAAEGIGNLAQRISTAGEEMSAFAALLREWSSLLGVAQSLVADANDLIGQIGKAASDVAGGIEPMKATLQDMTDVASGSSAALSAAMQQCIDAFSAIPDAMDAAVDSGAAVAENAAVPLRDVAGKVDAQASSLRGVRDAIASVEERVRALGIPVSGRLVALLDEALDRLAALSNTLMGEAGNLDNAAATARAAEAEARRLADEAIDRLWDAKAEYESTLGPVIDELVARADTVSATLDEAVGSLSGMEADLGGAAGSVQDKIAATREKIDASARDIEALSQKLTSVGNSLTSALGSGDFDTIRALLSSDPESLASAITAPVKLDRTAFFQVENFGSSMAPLYTSLALWIGSLLLLVVVNVIPTRRTLKEIDGITPRQVFLGRFGIIALLSFMQSTLLAGGNLLFLGVQALYPFLFFLVFWVSGLSFAFIIYALVSLVGNLGKALGVLVMIVQVAGGGGSFPLPLLPDFFQAVSPWLPITHTVNAMRASMFGIYEGDFWIELGTVVLFAVPLLFAGLIFIKPFSKMVDKLMTRVEESEIM